MDFKWQTGQPKITDNQWAVLVGATRANFVYLIDLQPQLFRKAKRRGARTKRR